MREVGLQAYIRAYPKWTDSGVSMWRLAQAYPRNQAAFNALIWLVEQGPRFFDSRPERDAVLSQVVDGLIRDHLDSIAGHLTDRNVAMALSLGESLPAAYRERLLRALFTRCRDRIARGRMGLILGRYLIAEADCIERLTRPGAASQRRGAASFSIRRLPKSSVRQTGKRFPVRLKKCSTASLLITATWPMSKARS